jgi:hypothetical protein
MRDFFSSVATEFALIPAVRTTAADGESIDLLGSDRAVIIVSTGAVAGDGDFGVKLQESDGGAWTDVAAEHVDSDAPATLEGSSAYRIGYRGHKRFIRAVLSKVSGTSIAVSAVAVLSMLRRPA